MDMNNTNTMSIARTTGLDTFCPEMGEVRAADAVIDASHSFGGGWAIKTPLTFAGRGVKFLGALKASRLTEAAQHKAGWNEYRVTEKAFKTICESHKVSTEQPL